jgi:hypothetical protein
VYTSGNVCLKVYRPVNYGTAPDLVDQHMEYHRYKEVEKDYCIPRDGLLIASFWLMNDDWGKYEPLQVAEDYEFSTNSRSLAEQNQHIRYDEDVRTDLLFERHVNTLKFCLVALLTATDERTEEESYEDFQIRVTVPAKARVQRWLKPLYEAALPESAEADEEELPQTFYRFFKSEDWEPEPSYYEVVHNGETFPFRRERDAVYVTLLLQKNPATSLVDAAKEAVTQSHAYRPE